MCRVHNCNPDEAVKYLRSHQSKLIFFSDLKNKVNEGAIFPFDFSVRQFNQNELVWRHAPKTLKRKFDDVFTGPQGVMKKNEDYTFSITSYLNCQRKRSLKVNVNDIKKFTIADTTNSKLNSKCLSI